MIETLSSPAGQTFFTTVEGVQPYYSKYNTPISKLEYSKSVYNAQTYGLDVVWSFPNLAGVYSTSYSGRVPIMKFHYGNSIPDTIISSNFVHNWSVKYDYCFKAPITGNYTFYFGGSGQVENFNFWGTSESQFSSDLSFNDNAYIISSTYALTAGTLYESSVIYKNLTDRQAGFVMLWQTDSASFTPEKVVMSGGVCCPLSDQTFPSFSGVDLYSNIRYSEKEEGVSTLTFDVPFVATTDLDLSLRAFPETVGLWKFNQNLEDESGNENDLTCSAPLYYTGYVQDGLTVFKAAPNASIDSTDATDFEFGTSSFTLEMWVKPNNQLSILMQKRDGGSGEGWRFIKWADGSTRLELEDSNGSSVDVDAPAASIPDTWVHMAAVVDRINGTVQIYADGTSVATEVDISSWTGDINASTLDFLIDGDNQHYFDEVCVTKKALTVSELLARSVDIVRYKDCPGYYYNSDSNKYINADNGESLEAYKTIRYSSGYRNVSNQDQFITRFTGQIRDFKIKYNKDGKDSLQIICQDYSVFTKDAVNIDSPNETDYWQVGYIDKVYGAYNGITKPKAFDGWELHKVFEVILTESYVDPYTFYNRKLYNNYNNNSTSGLFYIEPMVSSVINFLPITQNYGLPPIGESGVIQDDEYAYKIGTGEFFKDAFDKISRSWYYKWGFTGEGYPYLRHINTPYDFINSNEFSGSGWISNADLNAFRGSYLSSGDAAATAACIAIGKQFVLMVVTDNTTGSSEATEESLKVTITELDGSEIATARFNPYSESEHFYYEGVNASTGINTSKLAIANGLPYDSYRFIFENLSATYTTKIEGLLVYNEDYSVPTQIFYTGDSAKATITSLNVENKIEDQRTDCVVLGRRLGTLINLDSDGNEMSINPNNETYTYLQSAVRDLNSVYNSTASNYVGRPRKTIIVDPSILSQQQADFIAFNVVEKYSSPDETVSFKIQGNPTVEVGDCIAVVDDFKAGVVSSNYHWITSIDETFHKNYTTKINTTPIRPIDSYWERPPLDISDFGGNYIKNLKIENRGLVSKVWSLIGQFGFDDITMSIEYDLNEPLDDVIPIPGYFKIGREVVHYTEAVADYGQDKVTFSGITRGLGDYSTVTNFVGPPYNIYQFWHGPTNPQEKPDVVVGYNPYSKSQKLPLISFDLLVDSYIEVRIENYNSDIATKNPYDDYRTKKNIVKGGIGIHKVDVLTNPTEKKEDNNFIYLKAGHYEFPWDGFDMFGIYNDFVYPDDFVSLENAQFYALPNYRMFDSISSTSAAIAYNSRYDEVLNGFGMFMGRVRVRPSRTPNALTDYYTTDSSEGGHLYNAGGINGAIKTIFPNPGIIDMQFSTSGMFYLYPAERFEGSIDNDWYGHERERTGEWNLSDTASGLKLATNYPFVTPNDDTAFSTFILNRSNLDESGNPQGLLLNFTDNSSNKHDDLVRHYLPTTEFYIIQFGWAENNERKIQTWTPRETVGIIGEYSDINVIKMGKPYHFNPKRILEEEHGDGYLPKQWVDEWKQLIDADRYGHYRMHVTNLIFFTHTTLDLSGRIPEQSRKYQPLYSSYDHVIAREDYSKYDLPNVVVSFGLNSGFSALDIPEAVYRHMNKGFSTDRLPYNMTTSTANRGFYEWIPSQDTEHFLYRYKWYDVLGRIRYIERSIPIIKTMAGEVKSMVPPSGNYKRLANWGYPIKNDIGNQSYNVWNKDWPFNRSNFITWFDEGIVKQVIDWNVDRFSMRPDEGVINMNLPVSIRNQYIRAYQMWQLTGWYIPLIWSVHYRRDF